MSNYFNKKFIIIGIILIFIIFYVGHSLSDYGKFSLNSPPSKKDVTITPQLNNYEPGQKVKLEITFPFLKKEPSLFKSVIKSELIVSTDLINVSSHIITNRERRDPENIYEKTQTGIEYREIHFNLPLKKIQQVYLVVNGEVPEIVNREVYFAHNIQRNHYIFESKDFYLGAVKRIVKNG